MTVLRMPGVKELPSNAPRSVRSVMDTLLITPDGIDRWKKPPFQRELRITPKVQALIDELKANGGVVPGIITLGKLGGDTYLIDGQHRIEAFRRSGLAEGYADVRICHFSDMGEMGEEFVQLNSALVRMQNNDILRGLEGINEHLATIRRRCPFVGYDNIRRDGPGATKLIAMASAVRLWFGSEGPTPTPGPASTESVKLLNEDEARRICHALSVCFEAWGKDKENFLLWNGLNLSIVFWLWRRLVLREGLAQRRGGVAVTTLTPDQFKLCLMALSANADYVEWLRGRRLADRDRSPCYTRIKGIFAGRLGGMGFGKPILPIAEWGGR